jgi:hypothetical protein
VGSNVNETPDPSVRSTDHEYEVIDENRIAERYQLWVDDFRPGQDDDILTYFRKPELVGLIG